MRIIIDLQAAQGNSRNRGIGRYSLALAQAMVRNRNAHEIIIILSNLFPNTIEPIKLAFDKILPEENILVWHAVGPLHAGDASADNTWRRHASEMIREAFIASLQPDIVHIASLIEGWDEDVVSSIARIDKMWQTAVTFYDVIPFLNPDQYLGNPAFERWYQEKITHLKKADIFLAISESSANEAINHINASSNYTYNISAAADHCFTKINISKDHEYKVRQRFGLDKPFVMYSGATDDRKNHVRLIQAFSILPLTIRSKYQLAIVGGMPTEHREKFEHEIITQGLTFADVIITGRVSDEEMIQLYNLCHLFVFPSWHEGFGLPALEAMSCGAATIGANTTSVPEVIGREDALFDPFDVKAIRDKLADVLSNEGFQKELSTHALIQAQKFSWDESAKRAITAFELHHKSPKNSDSPIPQQDLLRKCEAWLIEQISQLPTTQNENDLIMIAEAIGQNNYCSNTKQLLVDVSVIAIHDAKSGIQRVVRNILLNLFTSPPPGFRIEPVYASSDQIGYRYARQFSARILNYSGFGELDEIIETGQGDIFLGLDLQQFITAYQSDFYARLRQIGVKTYFIVYDLLPILLPSYFPDWAFNAHNKWLCEIVRSDGVVCISRSVADELSELFDMCNTNRLKPLNIGWFHLGADINSTVQSSEPSLSTENLLLGSIASNPIFLMVGTIEPRKGHKQTLNAFEELWDNELNVNLVIVGKEGWHMSGFVKKIRNHPEYNKRLFWLEEINDEYLEKLYKASTCLIAASEGEGFGLPLIEAAQYKLPIIARNIPVFREVADEHAYYFSGLEAVDLANAISCWLTLNKTEKAPQSVALPWLDWKQSTQNLLSIILDGQWYKTRMHDNVHRFWGADHRFESQVGQRTGSNISTTGKAGYLIYGPYITMPSGQYRIIIRGKINILSNAHIDVTVDQAKYNLAETILSESDVEGNLASILVTLHKPCTDLEIRIWVSDETDLFISLVEIAPWQDKKDIANIKYLL